MKFLAVFVTLAAVAYGFPATTTWTLNELSEAIQSPGTDPILIPYLKAALNKMMAALHHGEVMDTITIAMPTVMEFTLKELAAAILDPNTNPAHIPHLKAALDKYMDAFFAGEEMPSITVVLPGEKPNFVDVWPVQAPEEEPGFVDVWPVQAPEESEDASPVQAPEEEPGFIDVWPVQAPEEEPGFIDVWPVQAPEESEDASPVAPSPITPVAPTVPSSPLVQIIVNVQQESDVAAVGHDIERPMPAEDVDVLPGWGPMI